MVKNYSLAEIKEELNREIEELEEKDPSYLNCRHCPYKGKCCIDNDIDIREDEWNEIKSLLDSSLEIKQKVRENFINDRKCYFRTDTCCLINDIRPTNCLYTPYQVIQNIYDFKITYSKRSPECDFETVEEDSFELDDKEYLKKIGEHYYLFLNHWFLSFENQSENCYKETGFERLREYFESAC